MSRSNTASPPPTYLKIREPVADDTIRILLATDNHIGYMERDPIRGQDSMNTFEEILKLAVKNDVDFILLAGDLFHENKPSRECLYKTIALLREYTLGDRPVQIDLLSDPYDGKAAAFSFPAINYEDSNLNIAIPVFSIHGNHDDPQGTSEQGALCALDILSASGLINYMGKIDLPVADLDAANTGIAVRPILLRKGKTHLALYGIGNVKDQRLHFELRSNRVRMFMPRDKESWFNILLLHQNRVKRGPHESVPEGLFDDSIDLVVWGHEHDCRIVPEPVGEKSYFITQPGSSVATSLADGESIPKHVALLNIQGKEFELTPIPLRTVRPFVIESVVLSEVADEEDLDLTDQIAISKYLKAKVNQLIIEANRQWDERNSRMLEQGEEEIPRMLPLVRLKVDTTGVSEMSNPIRFGQEFQGRIANPRDLLVFHRSKKTGSRNPKVFIDEPELSIDDPSLTVSERLAKVRVATLVKEYLSAQELQLLGELGMSHAIQAFVEKDDSHAIETHVNKVLKNMLNGMQTNTNGQVDENRLEDMLVEAKERQEKEYNEDLEQQAAALKDKNKGKDAGSGNESVDSMAMDVDMGTNFAEDSDEARPPPSKRPTKKAESTKAAAPKRGAARAGASTRGRGKAIAVSDDDDVEEVQVTQPPKKTNRSAVLSQKKAPAKKKTTTQTTLSFEPTTSRSVRSAAKKAKGKMVVDEDDYSD